MADLLFCAWVLLALLAVKLASAIELAGAGAWLVLALRERSYD